MGAGGRFKNEQFCCPIIYGSIAVPITKNDPPAADPSHTHRWTIFLRGANGEDLSHIIRKVSFKLHESFVPPTRIVEAPPFEVTESGWGEFEILIRISFMDSQEKPLQLFHQLQLYPKDEMADPDMDKLQTILSEHYDELMFNEPFEEYIGHLRSFRAHTIPKRLVSTTFTPQLEADEIKKLFTINEKILADTEKWKTKLARVENEKRKLEAEIRELENHSSTGVSIHELLALRNVLLEGVRGNTLAGGEGQSYAGGGGRYSDATYIPPAVFAGMEEMEILWSLGSEEDVAPAAVSFSVKETRRVLDRARTIANPTLRITIPPTDPLITYALLFEDGACPCMCEVEPSVVEPEAGVTGEGLGDATPPLSTDDGVGVGGNGLDGGGGHTYAGGGDTSRRFLFHSAAAAVCFSMMEWIESVSEPSNEIRRSLGSELAVPWYERMLRCRLLPRRERTTANPMLRTTIPPTEPPIKNAWLLEDGGCSTVGVFGGGETGPAMGACIGGKGADVVVAMMGDGSRDVFEAGGADISGEMGLDGGGTGCPEGAFVSDGRAAC
ncbi:NuA4 histone H4 acetyltransferase complex and the SWR1 complex subunit [Podochytrium sp. JEL0797]|nr:NuA4 histone H4 acetyltransferase complex and the SWR1 complex subunit [Podochytrium sp. JEL0797]